jgi:Protein of unknown function (DUF4238)
MPLDHYISQVHLKKFYSPMLGDRLYAIRKSDLRAFTPNAKGVCAINDGSTNAYLREDRAVEEFLKSIEPNYNVALDKFSTGKIDAECVYTIAGFVAYIATCSPAAMRIQSGPLKVSLEATAATIDAQGLIPPSPPAIGGKTLTELIESNAVRFTVDPKYPQAIGIDSINKLISALGNFDWDVIHNDFSDNPFFTSDYPIAIEATADPRVANRIVPLAPNLAIRIKPDIRMDRRRADFSFRNFRSRSCTISRGELVEINRLLVRCAEDAVFYRDDRPWIKPLIAKNRHYRVETITSKVPTPTGSLLISSQKITARSIANQDGE